jgi:hypothetical protein
MLKTLRRSCYVEFVIHVNLSDLKHEDSESDVLQLRLLRVRRAQIVVWNLVWSEQPTFPWPTDTVRHPPPLTAAQRPEPKWKVKTPVERYGLGVR